MKKSTYLTLSMLGLAILASCDSHKDPLDTSMKVGHVVCDDGKVMAIDECLSLGKKPEAVVFHVNQDPSKDYLGFATCLYETPPLALTDSIGVPQKTSKSLVEHDGNQNTYNLYSNAMCGSPLAEYVFDVLEYGQSAYIPSVSQMALLHCSKEVVNPVIVRCGGDPLADNPAATWHWTSTEVENQDAYKAWLFSISSGAALETPKEESHKARPVFTIYTR